MALKTISKDARGRYLWIHDWRPYGEKGPRKRTRFITQSTDRRRARREAEGYVSDQEALKINTRAGAPSPPRELQEATAEYLAAMLVDHSGGYVDNLRRSLDRLRREFKDMGTDAVTRQWLKRFQLRRGAETSPGSANREIAELRAFFAWEVDNGLLVVNPAQGVKKLLEPKRIPKVLHGEEYAELWHSARPPIRDAMDVLVCQCLRRGEIRRIDPGEDMPAGQLVLTGRKRKHGEPLVQVMIPPVREVVLHWLAQPHWPYLSRISHNLGNLRLAAGRPRIGAHALRHTGATWLLAAGVDIYRVKEHLGHSDVAMTEQYVRMLRGFEWENERKELPERTLEWFEATASSLRPKGAEKSRRE